MPEMVIDGSTGRVVDARETGSIADGMRTFLGSCAAADEFGAAAREHASVYRPDAVAHRLLDVYRAIAGAGVRGIA
jgi:glycosyltransferase involved in cell wall biosynthesis